MAKWYTNPKKVYLMIKLCSIMLLVLCLSFAHLLDDSGSDQPDLVCHSCLSAIAMTTAQEGWAMAGFPNYFSGAVHLHRGATQWVWLPNANDVVITLSTDATGDTWFVAGAFSASGDTSEELLRYHAGAWQGAAIPIPGQISDLVMLTPEDGWATAQNCSGPADDAPCFLHFDGARWHVVPTQNSIVYNALAMIGPNDGWAVGALGQIAHFTHGRWQMATSPTVLDLDSIQMITPTDGWATGNWGVLLHYDGHSWQNIASQALQGVALTSLAMVSPDDGWATSVEMLGAGHLWHWHNRSWHAADPPGNEQFSSVQILPSGDVWAAGVESHDEDDGGYIHGGVGVIGHFVHSTWQIIYAPRSSVEPVNITLLRLGVVVLLLLAVASALVFFARSFHVPQSSPLHSWWARVGLLASPVSAVGLFFLVMEPLLSPYYNYGMRSTGTLVAFGGMLIAFIGMFGVIVQWRAPPDSPSARLRRRDERPKTRLEAYLAERTATFGPPIKDNDPAQE
jgi:hypothetical protein